MAPNSKTDFYCMTAIFYQRWKPKCTHFFWLLVFPTIAFSNPGPKNPPFSFSGIRSAFQNESKVGIVFWRQGTSLGIFDFKTKSLNLVTHRLMPKKGPYSVVGAKGSGFVWVYHSKFRQHSFITDGRGKLKDADNFFYLGDDFSRWQVTRLFPTTHTNHVFMVLKQWDRNQWRFVKFSTEETFLNFFHQGEWRPEIGLFLDEAQENLIWFDRYTANIEIRDPYTLEVKKRVRSALEPVFKIQQQPGSAKYRWRLEAPLVVNGVIYFQENVFRDEAGRLLEKPQRRALALDQAEWWETKLYPLAYFRGQYLAVDRETRQLGLVKNLNQAIVEPLN